MYVYIYQNWYVLYLPELTSPRKDRASSVYPTLGNEIQLASNAWCHNIVLSMEVCALLKAFWAYDHHQHVAGLRKALPYKWK